MLRLLLPLVVLTWAGAGWAQDLRVESYQAPADCPDAEWFATELGRRGPSSADWEGAVRVTVEARDTRFVGRVQRAGTTADPGTREVEHRSCEQVVRALALIASLLLTPNEHAPSPAARSLPDDPPEPPLVPPAPRLARSVRKPAPFGPPSQKPRGAWRIEHGLSVGIAVQSSVAPDLRIGPRVSYRLALLHPHSQSELGLSYARIQSGTIDVGGVGSAELTYNAGRVQLCHAVPLGAALWVAPCGALDIGELSGRGSPTGKRSVTRGALWLSPGLFGKVELRPRRPLFAEVTAGSFFPLSRPEFHFTRGDPATGEQTIQQTPKKLGFSAGLSLGVLFP